MSSVITIGADPEFGFLDDNARFVSASVALKDYDESDNFLIGKDGGQRAAELRPDPSLDVDDVVKNIKKIMQAGLDKRPYLYNLFWKAGSYVVCEPIGGHIHLGVTDSERGLRASTPVLRALGKVLSKTVGVVGVYLENDKEQIYRRSNSDYGSFFGEDSTRFPAHGLEWRSLGSWLTSPGIARGILSMAKLVTNSYMNDVSMKQKLNDLKPPTEELMTMADRVSLKPYLQEAVRLMKQMDGWSACKERLKEVVHCLAEEKDWGSENNLVESWGLERPVTTVQGVS